MEIVVRCDSTWLDFDLAGRSPRQRLNALLVQFGNEPLFMDSGQVLAECMGPRLWIEGLFPLMCADELDHFLSLARAIGGAAWTSTRREYGLLFQANAATTCARDYEEMAEASSTHHEHPLPKVLNGSEDLAPLLRSAYSSEAQRVSKAGALLLCLEQTFIDADVTVGEGTLIAPNVTLSGCTTVGRGARIETGAWIKDAQLADGVQIKPYSVIEGAKIGSGSSIGPFAHIRPGTELGDDVRIGNFVETKNIQVERGSKASHLSYLGDATIGEDCNIGAGTITCNYDGMNKSQTVLGDRVFIGSGTQLVAPVILGDDVYVGAGSTVVNDVPTGALALSRSPQVIKSGLTSRLREKAQAKYEANKLNKSVGGS